MREKVDLFQRMEEEGNTYAPILQILLDIIIRNVVYFILEHGRICICLQFDISISKLLSRIQDGVSVQTALDDQLEAKERNERIAELKRGIGGRLKGEEYKKAKAELDDLLRKSGG